MNGAPFRVSERADLAEAVVSVGLSKTGVTIAAGLPLLQEMVHRARKCRLMGSAALDMAYVACGRLDAYIEQGISLWDIAAGWILVETAGGTVDMNGFSNHINFLTGSNGVVTNNGLSNSILTLGINNLFNSHAITDNAGYTAAGPAGPNLVNVLARTNYTFSAVADF